MGRWRPIFYKMKTEECNVYYPSNVDKFSSLFSSQIWNHLFALWGTKSFHIFCVL